MKKERRFAIIIGINDYENSPLNYCVNDAISIKEKLVEKCRFNEEDVFLITSSNEHSNKEIAGKYMESIRSIREKIDSDNDSILFYFAGHGRYRAEKSNIMFHDSEYPIIDIFNDITQLDPKVQIYIIDSCQSGGKVIAREEETRNFDNCHLEKYIQNSSGAMLLYACQTDESAWEDAEKEHGLLTFHFINAIDKEDLYDDEGILTTSRIQEYVSKETSKSSNFTQIPVVENRIAGYYPFAILKTEQQQETKETNIIYTERDNKCLQMTYHREARLELQEYLFNNISKIVKEVKNKFINKYENYSFTDINDIRFDKIDKLIEKLVVDSRKNNIEPIQNIYQTKKIVNPTYKPSFINPSSIVYKSLFKLFEPLEETPKTTLKHIIEPQNEYIDMKFEIFISKNIREVSFGLGFIVYQAKWGLVLTTILFELEWDGEQDSIINNLIKKDYPFLLDQETYIILDSLKLNEFTTIQNQITKWDKKRERELENFINSTIKKTD